MRRLVANTGVVFGALNERDGQLREPDRELRARVRDHGRPRRGAPAGVRGAAHVRARVARDDRAARPASRAPPTRSSRSCARPRASSSPTLDDLAALAPDLEAFFRDLGPLIDASAAGFPAAERILRDLAPLLGAARSRAAPGQPRALRAGLLQARADGVLRQHRGRHAGRRDHERRAACTTCAPRTRSARRTSPPIRAASAPTARTRTRCPGTSTSCARGSTPTRRASARRRAAIPVVDNTPLPYGDGDLLLSAVADRPGAAVRLPPATRTPGPRRRAGSRPSSRSRAS